MSFSTTLCHNDPHRFYLDKTDSIHTISETRKKELP